MPPSYKHPRVISRAHPNNPGELPLSCALAYHISQSPLGHVELWGLGCGHKWSGNGILHSRAWNTRPHCLHLLPPRSANHRMFTVSTDMHVCIVQCQTSLCEISALIEMQGFLCRSHLRKHLLRIVPIVLLTIF